MNDRAAAGSQIFILDDDDSVRESLAALLQTYGYTVVGFGRADAFLEAVTPATHGCLILDMQLPDMDGLAVLERLRTRGLRLQTVVVTAFGDIPIAVAAMKAGAIDFIEKPFDDALLLFSIRAALDADGRALDASLSTQQLVARRATLTEREHEVLLGLVSGKQNKQIAFELGISPRTVEIHRARVMRKMQATSLSHLVRMVVASEA